MMLKVSAALLGSVLVCALNPTTASARSRLPAETPSSVAIAEASPTLAPFQHVRFCLHYPADCKSDPTQAALIELNDQTLELMNRVNQDVNAAIAPVDKMNDGWAIAPAAGDCNDYAVTKRHELLQSGLPARALRLAVVKTTSGIGHLVLVVASRTGYFVLDNLTGTIRPWQNTEYHWLKIQSSDDPQYWYGIKVSEPQLVLADRKLHVAGR